MARIITTTNVRVDTISHPQNGIIFQTAQLLTGSYKPTACRMPPPIMKAATTTMAQSINAVQAMGKDVTPIETWFATRLIVA